MIRVGKIHPQGTVEMELVRLRGVGLRVVGGFILRPAKYAVAAAAFAASVGAGWAADLPVAVKAAPAPAYLAGPWFTLFSGVTASPDSIYGEAGAVFALGHNLDTPGWLFRIKGGGGHYEYNRAPGLKQGVDFETGDLMLGYQTLVGRARITAYFGGSVEHHDNPDPLATVKGTRGGAKFQGEIYAPLNDRMYFFALGSISSVFTFYYTQAKVGYKVMPGIAVGPEVQALGNDRFDNVRLGPFVAFDIAPRAQLILSGGYSWDTRRDSLNDHSGGFASAHVRGEF